MTHPLCSAQVPNDQPWWFRGAQWADASVDHLRQVGQSAGREEERNGDGVGKGAAVCCGCWAPAADVPAINGPFASSCCTMCGFAQPSPSTAHPAVPCRPSPPTNHPSPSPPASRIHAQVLREVQADPAKAALKGRRARERMATQYSPEALGRLIAKELVRLKGLLRCGRGCQARHGASLRGLVVVVRLVRGRRGAADGLPRCGLGCRPCKLGQGRLNCLLQWESSRVFHLERSRRCLLGVTADIALS